MIKYIIWVVMILLMVEWGDELILLDKSFLNITSIVLNDQTYSVIFDDFNISISNVETISIMRKLKVFFKFI